MLVSLLWAAPNTGASKDTLADLSRRCCRGLIASLLSSPSPSPSTVAYLKPLQTGYPDDFDARFVFHRAPTFLRHLLIADGATRLVASNHTLSPSSSVDPLFSAGPHPTTAVDALHLLVSRIVGTLSQVVVDVALAVFDSANSDLLDPRSRGGEADPTLPSALCHSSAREG
uniref:Uncharacterized protein n=1 Tax=Oryza barthii TaxID=65489 RepID=A0A0D3HDW7_9ORYZ